MHNYMHGNLLKDNIAAIASNIINYFHDVIVRGL